MKPWQPRVNFTDNYNFNRFSAVLKSALLGFRPRGAFLESPETFFRVT